MWIQLQLDHVWIKTNFYRKKSLCSSQGVEKSHVFQSRCRTEPNFWIEIWAQTLEILQIKSFHQNLMFHY